MDTQTLTLLEVHTPWIQAPERAADDLRARSTPGWIARSAAEPLAQALEQTERAHLIIGPRQAGKSSLVWRLLAQDARLRGGLLYVPAEDPILRDWCRSPGLFANDARDLLEPGGTLFIDEAQHLDEAGLFIKGLIDLRLGWRIIVTGSASFHLLSQTRESLAGRATRHHVWPLDLREASAVDSARGTNAARRRRALDRLLVDGGYPAVWTAAAPHGQLAELLSAFVIRDASDLFNIERPAAFRALLELAAGQVGDLANTSEWAQITGVSVHTVRRYIDLMAETHVVVRVRPFIGGKRAELTKMSKVFFVDNGLRNTLRGGFAPLERRGDVGKLMENWVFSELHKRWPWPGQVRYWRTKGGAEADFVIQTVEGALYGFEVKAGGGRPKLSRGARSFIQAYTPRAFFLVCRGDPHVETIGETEVRWTPAITLPEVLEAIG